MDLEVRGVVGPEAVRRGIAAVHTARVGEEAPSAADLGAADPDLDPLLVPGGGVRGEPAGVEQGRLHPLQVVDASLLRRRDVLYLIDRRGLDRREPALRLRDGERRGEGGGLGLRRGRRGRERGRVAGPQIGGRTRCGVLRDGVDGARPALSTPAAE